MINDWMDLVLGVEGWTDRWPGCIDKSDRLDLLYQCSFGLRSYFNFQYIITAGGVGFIRIGSVRLVSIQTQNTQSRL